jgi:hypothetical protein
MIGGLLSGLVRRNEETGLNPLQNIAASMDALVMPNYRMGEQIRQQGLQRVAADRRNATIAEMQKRADAGDTIAQRYLQGIQSGALDMKTGFAGYLNEVAANERLQRELNARAALAAAKPKSSYKTMTGAQINKLMGSTLPEGELYNLSSTGQITKVGGGGITIEGDKGVDEFAKMDAKNLSEVFQAGATAQSSLAKIERLADLLSRTPTGGAANVKVIAGDFGIETEGLDDLQAARALINQLVPAQRPAGSGPMSDADLELFKQSLPRIINTPRGNEVILETMRGIARYDAMGAKIVQDYRAGRIDKNTAFQMLLDRPDPFAMQVDPTSYF